jgi:hypothetical protein
MDFNLYGRVLWRFRKLVAAGTVLALLLSLLTVFTIGSHGLTLRHKPVYRAQSTLLLTQPRFPAGRAVSGTYSQGVAVDDPNRLSSIATYYVQLVSGDALQSLFARSRVSGKVIAAPVYYTTPAFYSIQLPMMTITASSSTSRAAVALAAYASKTFRSFVRGQQNAASIASEQRVVIEELRKPDQTLAVGGAKKTLAAIVFLTVMMAVVGMAFVLENLRPSLRPIQSFDPYAGEGTKKARQSA